MCLLLCKIRDDKFFVRVRFFLNGYVVENRGKIDDWGIVPNYEPVIAQSIDVPISVSFGSYS